MAKKIVNIYCLIKLLYGVSISFFFATYVVFLKSNGLGLLEINLVNAVFMLSCFFLEVPTGAIADVFGRKVSFVASCFVLSFSMYCYYASDSFAWFCLAEFIGALGAALYSGAFQAWMVDAVNETGEKYDLAIAYKRGSQCDRMGVLAGVIAGGYIGQRDIALPWLVSSVFFLLCGIVAWLFIKEKRKNRQKEKKRHWQKMQQTVLVSFNICQNNFDIRHALLLGTVWTAACMAPNMYWQLRFQNFGSQVSDLGWIHAVSMVMIIIGTSFSIKLKHCFGGGENALLALFFLFALSLMFAGQADSMEYALLGFYLHEASRGPFSPIIEEIINQQLDEEMRATVLSFAEMIKKLGGFFGLIFFGLIAKFFSIELSWTVSGLLVLVAAIILLLKKK